MSWVEWVWPMMAAVCFTLALIHFLIGIRGWDLLEHLLLSEICICVGGIAILELKAMHSTTPEQFAHILRWGHVAFGLMIVGIVWFVRRTFQAGSRRLGTVVSTLYLVLLIANFAAGDNLHLRHTTGLSQVELFGVSVVRPTGEANPWMLGVQICLFLMVAFLCQVIVQVWRRGDLRQRIRVAAICGSLLVFVSAAAIEAMGMVWLGWNLPVSVNPPFVPVLFAISMDLGGGIFRSAKLAEQLKLSDASLRASELRTSLAVRAADIGLWTWNPVRNERWVSDLGLQLLGCPRTEPFRLRRLLRRVHPEDRRPLLRELGKALREGGEFNAEFRIDTGRGGEHWMIVRGEAESDAQAPELGRAMSGVFADITERRVADLRFKQVVEAAPAAMLMADARGRVVLANRKAQEIFGRSREELSGAELATLLPGVETADAGLEGGAGYHSASAPVALHGSGREVPVDLAVSELRSGGESFLLASIIDISQRIQMERESALQRDELAHLSRVALLAELSGSLAHELNQPLTAILSNAQAGLRFMAHEPPDLEEVGRSLTNIVENDKRAGEVIRRLRAMLRKDPAEYRQLEVNEVVQDVLRIIRSDLLNRSVDLVLDLAPDLPMIDGDRVQLQQVLLNLVMNGSDAMSAVASGREMRVRTCMQEPGRVEVSVSDVGSGIPEADLERIFSPFVTSKAEGMGLGLAVCTTIIQSHGGRLWARNNPGRGATLSFYLPVSAGR